MSQVQSIALNEIKITLKDIDVSLFNCKRPSEDLTKWRISSNGELFKGYERVNLIKNSQGYMYGKIYDKKIRVHRIVAMYFCNKPISKKKLIVNHKNENKQDNNYKNLEWVTYKENKTPESSYNIDKIHNKIQICVIEDDNSISNVFNSVREAARFLERDSSAVTRTCQGEWNKCAGKKLKYLHDIKIKNSEKEVA